MSSVGERVSGTAALGATPSLRVPAAGAGPRLRRSGARRAGAGVRGAQRGGGGGGGGGGRMAPRGGAPRLVLLFSGKRKSGKDFVAEALQSRCPRGGARNGGLGCGRRGSRSRRSTAAGAAARWSGVVEPAVRDPVEPRDPFVRCPVGGLAAEDALKRGGATEGSVDPGFRFSLSLAPGGSPLAVSAAPGFP